MENQENMIPDDLEAMRKFMVEYGGFLISWGNFELRIEVLIWHLKKVKENLSPIDNCAKINVLSGYHKCETLKSLLQEPSHQDVRDALEKAYNIADRNGWIHGHIMHAGDNLEQVARFRYVNNEGLDFKILSPDPSPFYEFNHAVTEFEKVIESSFGITVSTINAYMRSAIQEQRHEDEP